jgi:hypothetical protein
LQNEQFSASKLLILSWSRSFQSLFSSLHPQTSDQYLDMVLDVESSLLGLSQLDKVSKISMIGAMGESAIAGNNYDLAISTLSSALKEFESLSGNDKNEFRKRLSASVSPLSVTEFKNNIEYEKQHRI